MVASWLDHGREDSLGPDEKRPVASWVKASGPSFTAEDPGRMFRRFQRLSVQPSAGEPSSGRSDQRVAEVVNEATR